MKNYFKEALNKQIKIKETLGWKKYLIALLLCGYTALIMGKIATTLFPKKILFLIISQIITMIFLIFFLNKHLYDFTIKNERSRYKKFKRGKGDSEICWLDAQEKPRTIDV